MVKKKQSREELAFPIATIPNLSNQVKPQENSNVIKQIIRGAVKGAFQLKTPSEYGSDYGKKQKPIVSEEKIQLVQHLIESLQPADAIEAALASQFVIVYIRGIEASSIGNLKIDTILSMFEFTHSALEALTKYRTKNAQLINVQYNHNQGQINNISLCKNDNPQPTIEVC